MNKLKYIVIASIISLSISLHPSASMAATADKAIVTFPAFPVTVNGTAIDVKHSKYPLIVYKDITYFPMTWDNMLALGLSANWDTDRGLTVTKNDACQPLNQNLDATVNANDTPQAASIAPFSVSINGKPIINADEPYPLLFYRDITYFPMTWKFAHDEFGWNTSWDASGGYSIESCGGMSNNQLKQADDLNKANRGLLAVQGEWIYMNPRSSQLVKAGKSSGEEILLADDNAMDINVVGDWVYYTVSNTPNVEKDGIYKIMTDGTQRTQIAKRLVGQMWVQDDWIYYISKFNKHANARVGWFIEPTGIRKMRTDGSNDQMLAEGAYVNQFFLTPDRIYFTMREEGGSASNLYEMDLNGSNRKLLQEKVQFAIVIDGWVYYVQDSGKYLNKMSPDGSVIIPLYTSDKEKGSISTLQYRQGWIYMAAGSFGIQGSATIYKLKIDGDGMTEVDKARATALYFADKTLYFNQSWKGSDPLDHKEVE